MSENGRTLQDGGLVAYSGTAEEVTEMGCISHVINIIVYVQYVCRDGYYSICPGEKILSARRTKEKKEKKWQ